MKRAEEEREPRIAVIGAGPAGLSVAWYLKRLGYRDVMVFEKLARVGGLCKSITDSYMAFDLGGTYVTPSYRETLKIARSVGAERYRGKAYKAIRMKEDPKPGEKPFDEGNIWDYVRNGLDAQQEKLPRLRMALGVLRFWWLRQRVRRFVDSPCFEGVETRPDLCVSFQRWLEDHDLALMERMFHVPVTMLGYGFLDEVAAPYILKFMAPGTYWSMFLRGLPLFEWLWAWPQRFEDGFQRLWERIARGLNVRTEVGVLRIRRDASRDLPIEIEATVTDRLFAHDESTRTRKSFYFDKLIVACPFTLDVLGCFFRDEVEPSGEESAPHPDRLTLTPQERAVFSQIETFTYVQNTLHAVKVVKGAEQPFVLDATVVPVFPFDRKTIGKPWVVVQVWRQASRLLQFYSRIDPRTEDPADAATRSDADRMRADVETACEELLHKLGGARSGVTNPRLARWTTYDRWPYFPHVSADAIQGGFFRELDALQGAQDTYYSGGAACFEMVEAVVRHARYVAGKVDADLSQKFQRRTRVRFGPARPRPATAEALR